MVGRPPRAYSSFSVRATHRLCPCFSAANRFDHRPSGKQDQRDQAGVWSPDQDREPAGRDKRPPRHHHGNAGQHQLGPVPHYLLVSPATSRPVSHCRRPTFQRVKGQPIDRQAIMSFFPPLPASRRISGVQLDATAVSCRGYTLWIWSL